jgi:hypothetical protein
MADKHNNPRLTFVLVQKRRLLIKFLIIAIAIAIGIGIGIGFGFFCYLLEFSVPAMQLR